MIDGVGDWSGEMDGQGKDHEQVDEEEDDQGEDRVEGRYRHDDAWRDDMSAERKPSTS